MRSSGRMLALPLALFLVASCGKTAEKAAVITEVHTLDEAKTLAAKKGSFIVAEFFSPT